jgi:hypothetical protein
MLKSHFDLSTLKSRASVLFVLVCMVLFTAACPKIDTVKPNRPPSPPIPPKPVQISRMKLPVLIEPIDISKVETLTPKTFGGAEELQWPDNTQLRYFVWRKPLETSLVDNTIRNHLQTYFYGVIEDKETGGRVAQCGYFNEPAQERSFNSTLTLEWAPEWHVKSTTNIQMDPAPFPCLLTIFNINVTRLIDSKLQDLTNKAGQDVDSYIANSTNVLPQATEVWTGLRQTNEISPRIWFQLHPKAALLEPITAIPTNLPSVYRLKTAVEFRAQPEIVIGNEPPEDTTPLPPLETGSPGEPGFDLNVDLDLEFCEANERLAREFPITINYGRHRVVLSEPKLEPFGSQVLLRLTIDNGVNKIKRPPPDDVWSGIKTGTAWLTDKVAEKLWKAHGVVFLTGTPTFDSKTRDLFFPDLDFEIHTKNVLLKAIGWVFHSPLQEQLKYKSRLNVGEQLDNLRMGMNKGLNRDLGGKGELTGYTDTVDGESVYVTDIAIKARFKASGKASLRLTP